MLGLSQARSILEWFESRHLWSRCARDVFFNILSMYDEREVAASPFELGVGTHVRELSFLAYSERVDVNVLDG